MRNGQKCSHCGIIGHNLRTCTARQPRAGMGIGTAGSVNSVKLFGVLIDVPSSSPAAENEIEKRSLNKDSSDFSALSLVPSMSSSTSSSSSFPHGCSNENQYEFAIGCLSDHLILGRIQQERKKSVSWSKEEHRRFLTGLEKLGKGDWRGISKKFVATRTPSQVASHAQKYFLKQNNNKSYTFKEKHLPNFSHVAKKDGDSKLMSPSNDAPIQLCCPPS